MGRKYPRFLYCDAINTKSEGPFIIHTLSPKFICQPEFDKKRRLISVQIVDNWDSATFSERYTIQEEISKWFNFSGRQYSAHPKDRILSQLSGLEFLSDNSIPFTVDQAVEVVKICFPTKTKTINQHHTSYGLKHLMERISDLYTKPYNKYCSNDTMKAAFELLGFNSTAIGPNCQYNISEKDYNNINELTER